MPDSGQLSNNSVWNNQRKKLLLRALYIASEKNFSLTCHIYFLWNEHICFATISYGIVCSTLGKCNVRKIGLKNCYLNVYIIIRHVAVSATCTGVGALAIDWTKVANFPTATRGLQKSNLISGRKIRKNQIYVRVMNEVKLQIKRADTNRV